MREMQPESPEDQPTVNRAPRLSDDLHALPADRARAEETWLSTALGTCRVCGELVYPTDSRQRDPHEADERVKALLHLPCLLAEKAEEDGSET